MYVRMQKKTYTVLYEQATLIQCSRCRQDAYWLTPVLGSQVRREVEQLIGEYQKKAYQPRGLFGFHTHRGCLITKFGFTGHLSVSSVVQPQLHLTPAAMTVATISRKSDQGNSHGIPYPTKRSNASAPNTQSLQSHAHLCAACYQAKFTGNRCSWHGGQEIAHDDQSKCRHIFFMRSMFSTGPEMNVLSRCPQPSAGVLHRPPDWRTLHSIPPLPPHSAALLPPEPLPRPNSLVHARTDLYYP